MSRTATAALKPLVLQSSSTDGEPRQSVRAPKPKAPKKPFMKHPEDLRQLGCTALFFAVFLITWYTYSSPYSGGVVGLLLWLSLCQLSFMGAVATHNCIHTPVFRLRWMNDVYQICLSLQYGFPVSIFVPGHNLSHHKYPQQAKDIMRTTKVNYRWNFLNGVLFFWHVVLTGGDEDQLYFAAQARLNRPIAKQRRREQVAVFGTMAVLILIDWQRWIWWALLPQFYAKYCILSLNMLQHDGCDIKSKYNFARNFTDPLLNWVAFNNGFHTIHHLYPGLHWSVLPRKHQEMIAPHIAPSLEDPSIFGYMWRSFIWPGVRLDFRGEPLVLTQEELEMKNEPWFYDDEETYSKTEQYLASGMK